ncbi:major allergen Can f 1-like [Lynx canadensis]|uniref:Major allergen Can f 1-like n=1 Tax=Lynx canadensis TaxID=61383 RepID=A0A667ILI9_LYNCA|nr:major allergen Can f 1-like [Lynx canadensis]XP_046949648.1 major allergen Can f 1-like [Lynx rufus]
MKALLLAIGLGLITVLQAQDPPASGEDTMAMSGKWYLKAMITDRETSWKKPELVTPMTLTVLEGGNLKAETTLLINGQCKEVELILEKTSEPNKYMAYGGKRVVYIEPTEVKDHYILYCEGEIQGEQARMAKLVGRDRESNEEALENFREFLRAKGFNQEIFSPKQSDTCPPGTDQEPEA